MFIYLFIYGSVTDDRAVGAGAMRSCPFVGVVDRLVPNVFQPCHFDSAVDLLSLGAGPSRLSAGFQGDLLQCDAHAAFPHDGTVWSGDVFVENIGPGDVEKLGFGWDEVHKINPRCIMASLKGFNKGSRFEHVKAFESVAQSAGGAASTTGWYDGERNVPTQSGAALGDSNSGMHLLIAILSALLQRQRTGEGCYVYQSMQNAVLNLCRVKLRDQLILDRLGKLSYYDCYPNYKWGKAIPRAANAEGGLVLGWCYRAKGWETDQNAYVYIVIQQSKKGFENFCHAMGFEDWITDPRFNTANARDEHKEEVYKRVEEYTMQYDKYTLTKELGAKGVPVGPVLDWNELENDPDLNDDGTIVTIDQQDARGDFKTIGMPFTMSNFTPDYQRAPKLGENNEEILKGLGYSDDQISELLSNGVIGGNDGVKADLK